MATAKELQSGLTRKLARSATVPYVVFDAADEDAVFSAVLAEAPATLGDQTRGQPEITKHFSETTWFVNVPYEIKTWSATPDSRFSFDTSGGTTHITQSRETIARYGPKKTNHNGLIGLADGRVEGCDIVTPQYTFSETHFFDDIDVDNDYKQILFRLTGRVNDASFKGFTQGEVLFLGATGSRQGDDANDKWEIAFRFAASENEGVLSVGSITGIDKKGWQYLWIEYFEAEVTDDGGKKHLAKTPGGVYIERVYREGDFSTLNIGTD